jgi:hypothetical protein
MKRVVLPLGALFLACTVHTTSGPAPAPAPVPTVAPTTAPTIAPTTAPTTPEPAPVADFKGGWSSLICGARNYERRLTLMENGTISGDELVSPCPPNAQCVWSGIVSWKGTWTAQGNDITLVAKAEGTGAHLAQLPQQLHWDPARKALYEDGASGPCLYTRL